MHPAGDPSQPSYAQLATPAGLRTITSYADGVGPWKNYIIPRTADDCSGKPTSFVRDAHRAGLVVHPYTFRRENTFLPWRTALVFRPRRHRRPRLGDPPVHPGRSGR